MDFELKRTELISIRITKPELENIQKVCKYHNITHANLFRSLFKKYYDEFVKVEKNQEKID